MPKHQCINITVDQRRADRLPPERTYEACEYLQIEADARNLEAERTIFNDLRKGIIRDINDCVDQAAELLSRSTREDRKVLRRALGIFANRVIERTQQFERSSKSIDHSSKRRGQRSSTAERYALIRRHLDQMTGMSEAERVQELSVEYRRERARQRKEWFGRFRDDPPPSSTTIWRAVRAGR